MKSRFWTLNLSKLFYAKKYPVQTIKWKFYFRIEIRDLINELLENFHSFSLDQSTRIKLIQASGDEIENRTIVIFTREINPSFQPVLLFVQTRLPGRENGCSENYAPNEPWHASLSKRFTKLGHPRTVHTMLKHRRSIFVSPDSFPPFPFRVISIEFFNVSIFFSQHLLLTYVAKINIDSTDRFFSHHV